MPMDEYSQNMKLEGILKYTNEKRGAPWQLHIEHGGFSCQSILNFGIWRCDGIIAFVTSAEERARILSAKVPTVLVDPYTAKGSATARRAAKGYGRTDVVTFICDYTVEGQTAARYFLDRHFRHFAYLGAPERTPWIALRGEAFRRELSAHGFGCSFYRIPSGPETEDFALEQPRLIEWLKELPKPIAVLASYDERARQLLMAADAAGIAIPHQLAVLGVDNYRLICETSCPPISSIDTNDISSGYAYGRALEELICRKAQSRVVCMRHSRVVTRASTDINAIDDALVAKALAWIQNHLSDSFSETELAAKIKCSKRLLQMRIRNSLGTTLREETRRMRLRLATDLLSNTDKTVLEIAYECGFNSPSHFGARFHEAFGTTPRAYRLEQNRS